MLKKNLVYVILCEWLYSLQLSYEALYEAAQMSDDLTGHFSRRWSAASEDIASWALEEKAFILSDLRLTPNSYQTMESTIVRLLLGSGHFTADRLLLTAREIGEDEADAKPLQVRFYALYCHYMSRLLRKFEKIMLHQVELLGYQEQFSVVRPRIAALVEMLREDGETLINLEPDTLAAVSELVNHWLSVVRHSVDEVSAAIEDRDT